MTKQELYHKFINALENRATDKIVDYLFNYFDSSELEKLIDFIEEEQQ